MLPVRKSPLSDCKYDIYPSLRIGDDQIFGGYESLARIIKDHRVIKIDGFTGVFFSLFREHLENILRQNGFTSSWISTSDLLKTALQIKEMSAPFLGGDDPAFGKITSLNLEDFFAPGIFQTIVPDPKADITVIIGPGASLAPWNGLLIYADIPKNEIQYRARAGSVLNLGDLAPADPKEMYKRSYFIDWVVLNKHKQKILPFIDIFVDDQRPDMPVWMTGSTLRDSLSFMSRNLFRTRPWFEPGAWGGTWIRNNIEGVNKEVPNYAWSFELITPENGLLIESSSLLCEVSSDCLMNQEAQAVLGDCHQKFGKCFPIRFDFLDTFDGGNLSLQCHPRPLYMKENFGEDFTQQETYYILDTKENAEVFLGFRENIVPEDFRKALEESEKTDKPFGPDQFILSHPVKKHDLLLIPYGTIHGSCKNNLVLEISTTPYIFTFKMYDWLRPGLDGNPRPLNIKRGMDNLYFERQGSYVTEKLIARPELIESGKDWQLFHLQTHETHLYDIHRYHFHSIIEIKTHNKCLVMNLVEGTCIEVQTQNGYSQKFSYAETFVIPAAAQSVRFFNRSETEAILVKAFIK